MKTLIVVHSYHHKSTEKIGRTMAEVLDAEIKPVSEDTVDWSGYDLIGLGAGIDSGKHYRPLLELAAGLPPGAGKKVFLFSTGALAGERKKMRDHRALRDILLAKGYTVVAEFQCKGYNTNSFLKYIGGMNNGRPNADDLAATRTFAKGLRKLVSGRV